LNLFKKLHQVILSVFWRVKEKSHSGTKELHRATILVALQEVAGQSDPRQAGALKAAGLRTNSGKAWTADTLQKFRVVN